MRLRLSDVRSTIARVLGVCETSDRVVDLLNEAQRRLLYRGKWVGTIARYRICINNSCFTWPRNIETIEAWSLCSTPGVIRNAFFEFLGNGPGRMTEDTSAVHTLLDRGFAATFDDPVATAENKVRLHSSVTETAGLYANIQGFDENAQWVRTLHSGSWIDGENIEISSTYQYSTTRWSNITGFNKPVTNGPLWLYEYSTTLSSVVKALGYYENDETVAYYRRSMIPGLADAGSCCGSESDCSNKTIMVLAKLAYIPVRVDADYLLLGNLPALKDMVRSIDFAEKNMPAEAAAYEASAIRELQNELNSHSGSGVVQPIRVENSSTFGAGSVENPIYAPFLPVGYRC